MNNKNNVETAGTARREVEEFISETLLPALCRFRAEFRSPLKAWFLALRDEIQRLRKDDEMYYKHSIDHLTAAFPDLKQILEDIRKEGWHQQFKDVIVESCSSLPEEIMEEQDKQHYESSEDDSAAASVVKLMKRIRRSVTGRSPVRTVKLRQLVLKKLLTDSTWIENLAAREYDELAMLMDLLLEKQSVNNEKENEEKAEEQTSFQLELFLDLENHLQVAVQHLKQFEEINQHQLEQIVDPVADSLRRGAGEAGTFALRQKAQPDTVIREFPASLKEKLEKQKEAWCRYLESQHADLNVQAEIARYGFIASSVKEDVLSMSHEFFRDTFYLPIEDGVTKLKEAEKNLDKLSSDSGKALGSNFEELRTQLQYDLQSHLIDVMTDEETLMVPVRRMQNLISDLQVETRRFSDELQLAKKRESKYPLPQLQFDTIRWHALASRFLKENAFRPLDPATQQLDQLLSQIRLETSEAVRVADVNLLAAIESTTSKEQEEEDPLLIAKEGIQRAIHTLEKSIRDVRQKQNAYTEIVTVKLPEAMHRLAQIMLKRDFESFELKDKALMVKEQAVNWKQILTSKWAVFEDRMELFWRFIVLKFKAGFRFVGPYIGFEPDEVVTVREKRNLVEYLANSGGKSDLPFIYRRLFDRDFSIDDRFYVPPRNGVDMITNSYDQWKRGLHSNVAVIGEKGSGKSTMIRFAKQSILSDTKPLELHFEKTFTTEAELLKKLCGVLGFKTTTNRNEFVEKVNQKKNPSVVVVENLQNIFVRNVNGYEALDAFWVVMSATMHKLFWVVSCSRYAWSFFMKMSSADQYFSHTVVTDQLDDKEIREAILLRHKATGYELEFEPDEYLKNSRAYKKVIGNNQQSQELIKENFFNRLSKISEGNPSIAMIFWLQSIKEFDERRFLFRPIEVTDVDKLEAPSRDVLFTLACLVLHDTLTKEEVAMALHEDPSQSRLMLARLKTKGIVYESDTGFNLNHLVYRQVVRLLKQRNILH
ncbi:MAG: hypothetical protein GVY08_10075 [Bacteroidetes bacterium]|jgi:hypothetical protein|nr:hypothetical protein [Bacteroidota bacterium]